MPATGDRQSTNGLAQLGMGQSRVCPGEESFLGSKQTENWHKELRGTGNTGEQRCPQGKEGTDGSLVTIALATLPDDPGSILNPLLPPSQATSRLGPVDPVI